MDAVKDALDAVLSIFLMAGVGAALYLARWLKDDHLPFVSTLVTRVALPCTIIANLFAQYTPESLIANLPGILVGLVSVACTLALGLLAGRFLKLPPRRMGVFVCMFSFSNSAFIGLPVSRALFGDGVTPYALLYYIANTSIFWSAGHALLRRGGGDAVQKTRRSLPAPLIVFCVCVLLVLVRFSPPKFVLSACGYVGNLVTPLSLIYIGAVMARMIRQHSFRWERGYLAVALGRFAVCPGLLLLCALPARLPDLMRNVLVVQAAMPVMSQTSLVAASTGSDEEYAAGGTAMTTLMALATIPLYMVLIEYVL